MSWLIPGISEISLPNPLEALALPEEDEPPDTAAVSPLPPVEVLVDVAETDDGPTAYAEVEETDAAGARLFCDVPLVADCTPDIVDPSGVVFGVVLITGVLSDVGGADAPTEALEGATTPICEGVSLRIRL
jgi:hypothetical protein